MACVIVCGVGGACDPALRVGDVVVASRMVDADGVPVAGADAVLTVPPVAGATVGVICSAGATIDGADARARLHASGVQVVETEACGWVAACVDAGTPLAVVRAVVDTPAAPLGVAATLVRAGASGPRISDVARVAAMPAQWPQLLRLGRAAALAERRAAYAARAAATTAAGQDGAWRP